MRIKSTVLALGILAASAIPAFATNKVIDFDDVVIGTNPSGGTAVPAGTGAVPLESSVTYTATIVNNAGIGSLGAPSRTIWKGWNATLVSPTANGGAGNTAANNNVLQSTANNANANVIFGNTITITGLSGAQILLNAFDLGQFGTTTSNVTNLAINGVAVTGVNGFTAGTNATFSSLSAHFTSSTQASVVTITWNSNYNTGVDNINYNTVVPEPASLSLLAIGGAGLLSRRRRA